jgi:peptidoglycan hydrolase CwlO-like protein
MERKWQMNSSEDRTAALIYSGVAMGLVAGAAISTYVWRHRVKAALNLTPLQRAEKLIEACEKKLDSIEESVRSLQDKGENGNS